MLVLRYFAVVGAVLLGCFWALDAFNGPSVPRAQNDMSSLRAWRAAEARKVANTNGRDVSDAIIMPDVATLAPSAERLAYENQLASNKIAATEAVLQPKDTLSNARAELTEAAPAKPAAVVKPKVKRKPVMVASPVPQRHPEFASGGLFGGIFSN